MEVSYEELLASSRKLEGVKVRVVGEMNVGFEADHLCPPEGGLAVGYGGCRVDLRFDWSRLGGEREKALKILKQWRGGSVAIEGVVSAGGDGRVGGRLLLEDISHVEWRGEGRTEYCLEYEGPVLPSPADLRLGDLSEATQRRCVDGVYAGKGPFGRSYCLDPVEPILWYSDAVFEDVRGVSRAKMRDDYVPFSAPAPYSNRDVTSLVALSEKMVFLLSDGSLHAWAGRESKLLAKSVEWLQATDSHAYYLQVHEKDGSSRIVELDKDLGTRTVWRAQGVEVERVALVFETLVIHRHGEVLRVPIGRRGSAETAERPD